MGFYFAKILANTMELTISPFGNFLAKYIMHHAHKRLKHLLRTKPFLPLFDTKYVNLIKGKKEK